MHKFFMEVSFRPATGRVVIRLDPIWCCYVHTNLWKLSNSIS